MIRTILTTFALVFLAELGDKTQLAVLAMLIGAGAALLASTVLAVVLGCTLPRLLPESSTKVLHYIAGGLFIIVGAWTIWKA